MTREEIRARCGRPQHAAARRRAASGWRVGRERVQRAVGRGCLFHAADGTDGRRGRALKRFVNFRSLIQSKTLRYVGLTILLGAAGSGWFASRAVGRKACKGSPRPRV